MAYMYVLGTHTSPPSPWEVVSTWNGKYLRTCSSVYDSGTVAGASTHRHNITAGTSGQCAETRISTKSPIYYALAKHSHTWTTKQTGISNNDPSFYQLVLWRIDVSVWETYHRCFPAGAVLIGRGALTYSGLTRISALDGRLIKLGPVGVTGGRTTHGNHSVDFKLDAASGGVGGEAGMTSLSEDFGRHDHTIAAAGIDSVSIMPARVQTPVYEVTVSETAGAPVNTVCFFDGVPSSRWTSLGGTWGTRFIEGASSGPTLAGTDSHSHPNASIQSSNHSGTTDRFVPPSGSVVASYPHSHLAVLMFEQADCVPPHVTLCPYYLNAEVSKINKDLPKTFPLSVVMQQVRTKTFPVGVRMQTDGFQFIQADAVIAVENQEVDLTVDSVLVEANVPAEFETGLLASVRSRATVMGSALLIPGGASCGISVYLAKRVQGTPLVLDSMLKSYVDQFDKVQMLVQGMEWANRLDTSTGAELDLKWGHVFGLSRWTGESDESYRLRIKTFTLAATGCGAAPAVEQILNELVGMPGVSDVQTLWPGEVHIKFCEPDAIRAVLEKESLIRAMVEMSLAAGIDYTLYLPIRDLAVSAAFRGPSRERIEVDSLLARLDRTSELGSTVGLVGMVAEGADVSALLVRTPPFPFRSSVRLLRRAESSVGTTSLLRLTRTEQASGSAVLMARRVKTAQVGSAMRRDRRPAGCPVTSALRVRRRTQLTLRARLRSTSASTVSLSALVVAAS